MSAVDILITPPNKDVQIPYCCCTELSIDRTFFSTHDSCNICFVVTLPSESGKSLSLTGSALVFLFFVFSFAEQLFDYRQQIRQLKCNCIYRNAQLVSDVFVNKRERSLNITNVNHFN